MPNTEVDEYVRETIRLLAKDYPDTKQALTSANSSLGAIQKRQKLIKLADKCDAGSLAVEEHESDELADDSDDAKRTKRQKFNHVWSFPVKIETSSFFEV